MELNQLADEWLDEEAGPIVRPYTVTSGRTKPSCDDLDLISMVRATRQITDEDATLGPEAVRIIRKCQRPLSVAEIAAHLDLPAGTVKVLLADLAEQRLIVTGSPASKRATPKQAVLKSVVKALRSL